MLAGISPCKAIFLTKQIATNEQKIGSFCQSRYVTESTQKSRGRLYNSEWFEVMLKINVFTCDDLKEKEPRANLQLALGGQRKNSAPRKWAEELRHRAAGASAQCRALLHQETSA